ncbi:MAG: phasin family protein [Proteobacteria bacterium]|nr:phasin family protein [Pseudomonadota bacterium]
MLEPDKLKAAGEAMKEGATKAAENSAALSMKVIDHAEENTRQAFAALRAAAKAGGVTEVMKVQADYVRDQGSRSMAQIKEVGEMIASFGRDAMSGLTGKKEG